jgi:hypothetical protein
MSTLSVHDLQGISAYSNTVRVPTGHNFETYGKLVANGTLRVPLWTTSTRPASPEIGMIGYNQSDDVKAAEIYTGTEKGWITFGRSAILSLADAVGVTPFLHYQASDLNLIGDGTNLTANNYWKNAGSGGDRYDLINDTSGHFSSNIYKTTQNSTSCAQFSGFCALAFKTAPYFTLVPASAYPVYTVAYVYGGCSNVPPVSGSTDSSPAFCGHAQGPNTSIPDRVGGGLFGWIFPGTWGNHSNMSTWYDNDGGVDAGGVDGGPQETVGNATPNQWINRVNTGSGFNTMKSWYGRSSAAFADASHSNISIGSGPTYGFSIPISGMGNVRRADINTYTTTGYLFDAVLFRDTALTDAQIQNLRNYYAAKYPFGNIPN